MSLPLPEASFPEAALVVTAAKVTNCACIVYVHGIKVA